jgi:hypothetical protein
VERDYWRREEKRRGASFCVVDDISLVQCPGSAAKHTDVSLIGISRPACPLSENRTSSRLRRTTEADPGRT